MRGTIIFLSLMIVVEGALVPTPFITSPEPIQRAGYSYTYEYFQRRLFHDIYGIAMVKPRGTNSTLVVASDPDWCRLIYLNIKEGAQEAKYLRAFGGLGTVSGEYFIPKGLCIDTTVYQGNTNQYAIYVADTKNNRVTKEKYKIIQDSIVADGILVSDLCNPTDVACVSSPEGGAYIVIAETDTHRIRLYQRSASGSLSLIQMYGTRGSGAGEFFEPQGVAICLATDATGGYFIYVTDTGNRRVVCLRYKPTEGITWVSAYRTMENAHFLSVTASQYYCVYVTDLIQNKIWVFTPGLTELLYTYGDATLLNGPKDICIDWDRIGLTERWTATTGIQYFKIIPEIREFYPEPDIFDATEDSVKINFRVDETAHYLTMDVAGRKIFENQYFVPGRYEVYWDGRGADGKVVLPGSYTIKIWCQNQVLATTGVTVKGTIKNGTLAQNERWTEEGEPYVLVGDVQLASNGRLEIDPGVKVMPVGDYRIKNLGHQYKGHIYARGTVLNKILFTPHRKLYPVPDSTPKGFWKGIDFHDGGWEDSLIFTHCIIEGAGSDSAAFWVYMAKYVNLTDCEISRSGGFGFYCDYRCDTVVVNNCRFSDNDSIPIVVPFRFIGEVYGNRFATNKPDVIGVVNDIRNADAVVDNQGVPYWFLRRQAWWGWFAIYGDNSPVLTIEPGVQIYFEDSCGLYAGDLHSFGYTPGRIVAIGKPDSFIMFSALDTTKHWAGIHIHNGNPADTSRFEYCEISYGGLPGGIDARSKGNLCFFTNKISYTLVNCKISRSMSYGVGDAGNFETDTCVSIIQDNIFYGNDSFPLVLSATELGECRNNQFIDNYYNAILVRNGGDIKKSMAVENQGVPYVIDCGLVVNGTATIPAKLDIEPGNVLKFFNQRHIIDMYGTLKAKGVVFTAFDTVWKGIRFDNARTDSAILDSCIIEKVNAVGGTWPRGAIDINNSWVRISNTAIVNCDTGIYVSGAASRLTLFNNLIAQNKDGITSFDSKTDSLYIKFNEFWGNKCAFRTNYVYPYLRADSNWWGDTSGPWDPSTKAPDYNPLGRGDSIGDYVLYRPWLTTPVQPPKVTLLQPNGGEVLYSGEIYEIKWSKAMKGNLRQLGEEKGSKGQIIKQELYYTLDFPEGGTKVEAFWRFIDTVPVSESSYAWCVPNTPSNRCRVAVKIYYNDGKSQSGAIEEKKSQTPLAFNESLDPAISIDISDKNFTIEITTDFDKSTAYNNGRKIVTSPTGNKVYFVYANEGTTVPRGIYSCYSQDSGRTWGMPEIVGADGAYPAIGLWLSGYPCASYVSGSKLAYTYWISSWGPPDTIVLPVVNLSPPSMVCDDKDTVHIVFVQYYEFPSNVGDLIYMKFQRTNFSGAISETLFTNTFCRTPSIGIDAYRNVHILWQGERCVCFLKKGGGKIGTARVKGGGLLDLQDIKDGYQSSKVGRSIIDTIYTTNTNERLYPVIDVYGNQIVAVWQDRDLSGNLEIFSRRKADTGWQDVKKVATTTGESRFPTLSGGHYCLWQDNTSGNWEVYKSQYIDSLGIWTMPENISNTLTGSGYPHSAYTLVNSTSAKLYCLWTEGDTIPYTIKFKKLDVSPVVKIFVDLGEPVQSPYCLERDGYWVFGDLPYQSTDWGYDNLRYKITGLDSAKEYRLDLAYYFENQAIKGNSGQLRAIEGGLEAENEKGIGRIIQVLVVDGSGLDTAFITPNKLLRRSVWLPQNTYGDGEINIDISKIKGKRVICSEIGLYEFLGEEKVRIAGIGGPQGYETEVKSGFYLETFYSNPAKGYLKLKFNSPDERDVSIKIYDVCGRLIYKKEIRKSQIGMNGVLIGLDGFSAGVYFVRLETDGFDRVEKVILLR